MLTLALLAVLAATPLTLPAQLDVAQAGDTVVLTGDISNLTLQNYTRPADKPVILAAKGFTLTNTVLRNVSGLKVTGANLAAVAHLTAKSGGALAYGYALGCYACAHVTFDGVAGVGPESALVGQPYAPADGYGIQFFGGSDLKVLNSSFAGFKVGVVFGGSDGFLVQNSSFERMRADGVDITGHHGRVTGNFFMATRIMNGEHPDAAQGWSVTGAAPTSDIEFDHNFIMSRSQGLDFFDHGTGGFDRVSIHDNTVIVDAGQGIGVVAARSGSVRNNWIIGLPRSSVHSNINTALSPGIVRCGNVVSPSAGKTGLREPACPD